MPTKRRVVLSQLRMAATLLVGLARGPYLGAAEPAVEPREQLEGLRASLSADGETCPEMGLYSFRLNLSNTGTQGVRASLILTRFSLGYLKILYRRPPGPFTELTYPRDWYPTPYPHPGTTLVELAPGESRGFDLLVGADPGQQRAVFPEAGEYEIKVVLRSLTPGVGRTFETDAHPVRVVPMDDQVRSLSGLWDYEMIALAQGDVRTRRLGELAPRGLRIVEAMPKGPYARPLRSSLLRFLDLSAVADTDPQLAEVRSRLKAVTP